MTLLATSTEPDTDYSVSVLAVDMNGDKLGAPVPITFGTANSTVEINWTPSLVNLATPKLYNMAQYQLMDPNSMTGTLSVPISNSNVTVDIYYALKTVNATFNYIDETTGKTLFTTTDTWTLGGPTDYLKTGIRPPSAILSNDVLTASYSSASPQTDVTKLPYFGPTGMIFNNSGYVLDTAKSSDFNPASYIDWPAEDITQTFYYKEAAAPTISISALNQNQANLKNISSTQIAAGYSTATISSTGSLPVSADLIIPGYTLNGVDVTKSGSLSGAADSTNHYSLTPESYSTYLASDAAKTTSDARSLGDYQNMTVNYTYQGNTVKLMAQPVDETGAAIGSPIAVGTGIVGDQATISSPTVENYKPVNANLTTTITPEDATIQIPYTKVPEINTGDNTGEGTDSGNESSGTGSQSTGTGNESTGNNGSTTDNSSSQNPGNTTGSGNESSENNSGNESSGTNNPTTGGTSGSQTPGTNPDES